MFLKNTYPLNVPKLILPWNKLYPKRKTGRKINVCWLKFLLWNESEKKDECSHSERKEQHLRESTSVCTPFPVSGSKNIPAKGILSLTEYLIAGTITFLEWPKQPGWRKRGAYTLSTPLQKAFHCLFGLLHTGWWESGCFRHMGMDSVPKGWLHCHNRHDWKGLGC